MWTIDEIYYVQFLWPFLLCGLVALIGGKILFPLLAKFQQNVNSVRLKMHQHKAYTPKMGGLIVLVGFLPAIMWMPDVQSGFTYVFLGTLMFFALGVADDVCTIRVKKLGIPWRFRLLAQFLIAALMLWLLLPYMHDQYVLHMGIVDFKMDLGAVWYWVFALLVIAGSVNAVNFTDGLDGLAAGCVSLIMLGLIAVSSPGMWPLLAGMLGSMLMYFLVYGRAFPARMFMGDTGSVMLGGFLALYAIQGKIEMVYGWMALVPVVQTIWVILRLISRKTGVEIVSIAPLHHWLERKNWSEKMIVFFLVTVTFSTVTFTVWRVAGMV